MKLANSTILAMALAAGFSMTAYVMGQAPGAAPAGPATSNPANAGQPVQGLNAQPQAGNATGTAAEPRSTAQARSTAAEPRSTAQARSTAAVPRSTAQARSTAAMPRSTAQARSTAAAPTPKQ
ncbi:MAG TPA: hypothetical protein VLK27_04260 [Chthoniobacterales bacterium]|nr:hypothetical protein [Chthoniobacterales bacterium]